MASRWRERSRRVIDRVLAGLPSTATGAEKRRAVSAAYPFGERAMHPYKMWLAEVRSVLGAAEVKAARPVAYTLTPANWQPPFWIGVSCDYCPQLRTRGCLMCRHLVDPLTDLFTRPDFVAMLRTCRFERHDTLPRLVLADWLDEEGTEATAELAKLFRSSAEATP